MLDHRAVGLIDSVDLVRSGVEHDASIGDESSEGRNRIERLSAGHVDMRRL